jgi:hypothetical protein
MKSKSRRVSFEGFRYQIAADGKVFGASGALRNEIKLKNVVYDDPVINEAYAEEIRAEARRQQRRNRRNG